MARLAWADTTEAQGQGEGEDGVVVVTKQITGKVSAINPREHFLTVIYEQMKEQGVEYEMLLSFTDDVELQYKRDLNELKYGDTIRVSYEEKQQEAKRQTADGKTERYTKILAREAKVITFMKSQMTGLVTE